ncbi:hypothetical protein F0U60_24410 [Archangium minus]|uniref:Lipoprotein n=1 Tax=Archangium minus TaxID=83450 RepID=A0ABY9WT02_9BACT|nr:hypothetical protein F0U60_24410 [Archangium minus]
MKNAMWAAGLSLTMGLMVGCGGVADETTQESSNLETRQDAIPDCSGGDYYTMYFSDATYTTQIGGWGCHCGAFASWGKTSNYSRISVDCE